jgi:hypothetical protein
VNPMALTRWKPLEAMEKPEKPWVHHHWYHCSMFFFYYLMALDGHLRECNSFSNPWRSEVLESEFVITTLRTHIQNRKSIISGPIFVVFGFNKNLWWSDRTSPFLPRF